MTGYTGFRFRESERTKGHNNIDPIFALSTRAYMILRTSVVVVHVNWINLTRA